MTALIKSAEGASAIVNAIYLPMAFISGAFFSPRTSPSSCAAIADVLPLTYFIRLIRDVMLHGQADLDAGHERGRDRGLGHRSARSSRLRYFRWEPTEG